jgi:hypothetical protein
VRASSSIHGSSASVDNKLSTWTQSESVPNFRNAEQAFV